MPGTAIGFDRRIDLEWMDAVAGQVAAGASEEEVRKYLWKMLDGVVSGDKRNTARGKTVTVLMHIWYQVPNSARPLQRRALCVLPELVPDQRLAVHWAMVLGTYPFAADVAAAIGKLLMLQGSVSLSLLTRRLVEMWGERSTLIRAAQRLIRSMVQWGGLGDSKTVGVYEPAGTRRPVCDDVAQLLLEALLIHVRPSAVPVEKLLNHPALFPFKLAIGPHQLRRLSQFSVHRQGLDSDVVSLADFREAWKEPEQLSLG